MSTLAGNPYTGYTLYKVLHKKENRYMAILVSPNHRTTIAYAKYVLETSLGRKLRDGFQAHHRDEDTLNDEVYNLEEKHKDRHRADHNAVLKARYLLIECPVCFKEALIPYRQTHWGKRTGTRTTCSRKCGAMRTGKPDTVVKKELWLTIKEVKDYSLESSGSSGAL